MRCTISDNLGASRGAGVLFSSYGGINPPPRGVLDHCTISGNQTNATNSNDAGGLYGSNSLRLTHCTITDNQSSFANRPGGLYFSGSSLTLENTIISGNSASSGPYPDVLIFGIPPENFRGTNFIGDPNGSGFTASASLLTGDALLGPLGDYGGPTQTMQLLPGSPAIDAVTSSSSTRDQRGFPRPIGAAADIGAVEAVIINNVSPMAGAGDVTVKTPLTWTGATGATFELFLGASPGNLVSQGIQSSPFTPAALLAFDTTYYWRVDTNLIGLTFPSEVQSFTTRPVLIVDNATDDDDGYNVGGISLRDAVAEAVPGETITFGPSLGGQTITLGSNLSITTEITIDGSGLSRGVTLHLDGNQIAPSGAALTLNSLDLSGGGTSQYIIEGFDNSPLNLLNCTIRDSSNGISLFANAPVTVSNCTFTNNTQFAFYYFGGSAGATLKNTTIVGNPGIGINLEAGDIVLENSIVAGNGTEVRIDSNASFTKTLADAGGNLIGDNTGVETEFTTSTLVGTSGSPLDPMLSPLGYYGGPTQTMPPLSGSPAINNGGATSLTTDQRGFPRIILGITDIGAVESGSGGFSPTGLTVTTRRPASYGALEISTNPDFMKQVGTLAGARPVGSPGFLDGPTASSQFSYPSGVAEDRFGNIFIADTNNHRIRMIGLDGEVTTIAGTGVYGHAEGPGLSAQFALPTSVALGPNGHLYVSDTFNHRIRKLMRPAVAGSQWTVSTLAGDGNPGGIDGSGFSHPHGLTLDDLGNVYIADTGRHQIRKVTRTGTVTTFAGTGLSGSGGDSGPMTAAQFKVPMGLAFDTAGKANATSGNLYIADRDNHRIRKIDLSTGTITTLAGSTPGFNDATGSSARFNKPVSVSVDAASENVYVADEDNHRIRCITTLSGIVTTIAGEGTTGDNDGLSTAAKFRCPAGLIVNAAGNLIVADTQNHLIRSVGVKPLTVETDHDPATGTLSAVIDEAALGLIRNTTYYFRWLPDGGGSPIAGDSFYLFDAPTVETLMASVLLPESATLNGSVDPHGVTTEVILEYSTDPNLAGPWQVTSLLESGLVNPQGVVVFGGEIFVADEDQNAIYRIDSDGLLHHFAGATDGSNGFLNETGAAARFDHPAGLTVDTLGNLYVADTYNHRIRKITQAGVVSTSAGSGLAGFSDGPIGSARFLFPRGVVAVGNDVYVADTDNNRIRVISGGAVSTVAGTGASAQFNAPEGLAVDAAGIIHVADTGNHRIRFITAGGSVVTLAGTSTAGHLDGEGASARFSSPTGLTIDPGSAGTLYVTDRDNHRIRSITPGGQVGTVAGSGVPGFINSPEDELHPATATGFNLPTGIALDPAGRLIVSDAGTSLLRGLEHGELPYLLVDSAMVAPANLAEMTDISLLRGATYYFRAVATNGRGRTEGEILSFTTPQSEIVVHNGDSTAAPILQPGQDVDFGSTPVDTALERIFTIENIGSSPLSISSVTASGGFTASAVALTPVPASGSTTFTVTLESASANPFTGEVVITSDDLDEGIITFQVIGEVLAPAALTAVTASDVTAIGVTFTATVDPQDSPTEVVFEYSPDPNFDSTLEVLTTAGSTPGFSNGCGPQANFDSPSDVAVDRFGNIYVADTGNNRIRRITTNGDCVVLAGTGVAGSDDGQGDTATFNAPEGLAVDFAGNVYVADTLNHRIRRIAPDGVVSTVTGFGTTGAFTDGVTSAARFDRPTGIDVAPDGTLYVADSLNGRIRTIANGEVSTLYSGSGLLDDVATDTLGHVYASEFFPASNFSTVLWIAPGETPVDNVKGGIIGERITGVDIDDAGKVYLTSRTRHTITQIDAYTSFSATTTVAGLANTSGSTDGTADIARFEAPAGIAVSPAGTVYLADQGNHRIRQIKLAANTVIAATGITIPGSTDVSLVLAGLDPDTTYYYRSIATNGGGRTVTLPLDPIPGLTFTTLDNNAELSGLTVNGVPVPAFNPCVYSYPIDLAPQASTAAFSATASSPTATLQLFLNEVYCCDLVSGELSDPKAVPPGENIFRVDVISADGSYLRSYSMTITGPELGTPFSQWQTTYFSGDAGDPLIAGPTADPSGDGVVNLLKYAFDLDPTQKSNAGLPTIGQNGGDLTLTFTKKTSATDLTYEAQWSTNLVDWFETNLTEEILDDLGTTQIIRFSVPQGADPERFMRLSVTLP